MSTHTVEHYLADFRIRVACCQALAELSERQRELIIVGDFSGLLELLNQKQQLLDQLLCSSNRDSEIWRSWRVDRDTLAAADRTACEALLDEVEVLMMQLLTLEETSTEMLTERRNETAAALVEVNHAGIAVQGYQSPHEMSVSRRLDLDL